jgi:hypothetical protein
MDMDTLDHRFAKLKRQALVVVWTALVGGWSFGAWAQQPPCGDCGIDQALGTCNEKVCCPPPKPFLYFQAEAIMLHRDVRGRTDVAMLNGPGNPVLTTSDLDEPFQAGPKFTVGHSFVDTPYQIEFSYFWLNNWDESAAASDTLFRNPLGTTGNLYSPFTHFGKPTPLLGYDYNNSVSIRETSYMDNGELNIRRILPTPPSCLTTSFLIGVRHMGIHEGFDYLSGSFVPLPQGSTVDIHTRTRNDLWGPQIGGLFEIYDKYCFWVNFEVKGALCNNSTFQETTTTTNVGGVPNTYTFRRSANDTAFVGDFDLTVVYRCTDHITSRIGYQAIWVGGLALSSRNFAQDVGTLTAGPAWLDRRGDVLYHGPHAELELSW